MMKSNKELAKGILKCYKEGIRFETEYHDEIQYFYIAGTMNIDDIFTDLNKYGRDNYHDGFMTLYEDLKFELINSIKLSKVVISGHSLGGAIARYFSNELTLIGVRVDLVTFGEPKCYAFKPKCVLHRDDRIVNGNDIVPRLGWFKLKHYTKKIQKGISYFLRFWNRSPIDNHYLKNYIKVL